MESKVAKTNLQFISAGGEMGALIRAKDWSKTPIGPAENWPQSLRTTLSIILNSRFPMFLMWGDELTCFYNDAFRPSLGLDGKHPDALGAPAMHVWADIWTVINPLIDQVMSGGDAIWSEDQLIPFYRNGRVEDIYWTFSYSPVYDEKGLISGVFVACSETTEKINTFKKLEESQRRYTNNIAQAPVAMCIFRGEKHEVEIANSLMLELWGKSAGDVVGKPIFEGLPEAKGQGLEALLDGVYRTGERFTANERPVNLPRGGQIEETFINFVYEALREPNGYISGIVAIAIEVTDQVVARKTIEESEKRFRTMAEGSGMMIAMADENGIATYFNGAWTDLTGRPIQELLDLGWADLIHPADRESFLSIYREALKNKTSFEGEFRLMNKAGNYSWLLANGPARYHPDGSFAGHISSCMDITERKNIESEQRKNEQKFRSLVESAPFALAVYIGESMEIELANQTIKDIWGKGNDVIGRRFTDVLAELEGQQVFEQIREVYRSGKPFHIQNQRLDLIVDGKERIYYFNYSFTPLFDSSGQVFGVMNTGVDLTELNLAKKKIEESEEHLNMVIEASELGTWELNIVTGELLCSDRCLDILGHMRGVAFTHEDLLRGYDPESLITRKKAFERAFESGQLLFEAQLKWPDGSTHWLESKGTVFYNEAKEPIKMVGTVRDITDDKYYQQQLEEREQKFRLLADSMPQQIWTGDAEGNLNYFNQSVYDFSGLHPDHVAKHGWLEIVHPDDRDLNIEVWMNAVNTGKDFLFEHRFRRHDGQYRWQLSRAIPQRDNSGKIQMWVGTSTDIHDQKTFTNELERQVRERTEELQRKNDELAKMNAELKSFVYISSHDLQEPLRKIQTFSTRVMEQEDDRVSEEGKFFLKRMNDAATRMRKLIDDLLQYSQLGNAEQAKETTDIRRLIQEVEEELHEAIQEKNATISIGDIPPMRGIPFQLKQMFQNLIGNSLKFASPDRAPHIDISSEKVSGHTLSALRLPPNLDYCHITFRDNGIGFDPEYSEKIFKVFQRLHAHEKYGGTGIGLAIVKRVVENHSGAITASSEVDHGTVFDIYLPLS